MIRLERQRMSSMPGAGSVYGNATIPSGEKFTFQPSSGEEAMTNIDDIISKLAASELEVLDAAKSVKQ